jgi:hypothetical protein
MDNPVLYQALGGLLVLFFLFLVFMFTKTWRWFHVVCMFFVFGAAVTFCFYAAMSYKTHAAWRTIVVKNRKKAEELETEFDTLMYGDRTQVVQEIPSIRTQNARFARLVFDRGRVWRECTPQGPQPDGTVVVNTVPASAAAGDPAANQIIQAMVLYAFGEGEIPAEMAQAPGTETVVPPGTKVPVFYLGEFSATAVTDTSVTLAPTLPLDDAQKAAMQIAGATWTLYEIMPIDGHKFFSNDPDKTPDLNRTADEDPIFGDMDREFLGKFLPPPQRPQNMTDESYQQLLDQHQRILDDFVRDGKRAAEDDAPDNTWVKVRFLEPHQEVVDSDVRLDGVQGSQDFFGQGRAEIPLLQRGGPAEFKKDDIGVFPQEDADRLITGNICERIEPIYVRSLTDYEYQFRKIQMRMVENEQERQRIDRNLQQLNIADTRTLTQIAYRQQESQKLQQDRDKFQYEAAQIGAYRDKLQKILDDTKAELSRLYRTNHQLEEELTRTSDELTEEINRRTREAVSSVGP